MGVTDFLKFNEPYVIEYILGNTSAIESNSPYTGNIFRINTGPGHFLDDPFPLLGHLRQKYINGDNSKEMYKGILIEPSKEVLDRLPFECPEVDLNFKRPQYQLDIPQIKKINVIPESFYAEPTKAFYRGHNIEGITYYAWTNVSWKVLLDFDEHDFGFCYEPQFNRFHAESFTDEQFKETLKDIAENGMREEIRIQLTASGQVNKVLSARLRSLAAIALELETIPVCFVFKAPLIKNANEPIISVRSNNKPINKNLIEKLNKIFYPYVKFTGELSQQSLTIPQNYIDYDNALLELNKKMIADFPKKIYTPKDLPNDYFD